MIDYTYDFDENYLSYENGQFVAKKLGNTTITATSNLYLTSCEIPVKINAYPGYVTVFAYPIECYENEIINIAITNNLQLDINYNYLFDTSYVQNNNNTLYAIKPGTTVIVASNPEYYISLNINVTILETPIYSVIFNSNGGEYGVTTCTVEKGNAAPIYFPTKENHKFIGWYTDPTLTIPYNMEPITEDTVLYAAWEQTSKKGCSSASLVIFANLAILCTSVALLRKKRTL